MGQKRETWIWAGSLLVAVLLVSLPAWMPGQMLSGHDATFHQIRIEGIAEGLSAGQFPVRVNPFWCHGYGMPSGIFYPDLFLYPFAALRMMGVPLDTVWRILLTVAHLVTAFAGWLAFSAYTRTRRTGAVAALFYLVFLYRLLDVYARAAVGEMLAMAFLPGALLFPWIVLRRDVRAWPWVVLFTTCILQSHVITSLLVVLADAFLALFSWRQLARQEVRRATLKAAGFTFLLNLWFYAPLLSFHRTMDYVMRTSLGGLQVWPILSLDFYMGRALLCIFLGTAAWMAYRRFVRHAPLRKEAEVLLVLSALVIFWASVPLFWRHLQRFTGILQFSFRLGMFPAVGLSLCFGILFAKRWRKRTLFMCLLAVLAANFYWMQGCYYLIPPPSEKAPWNMHFSWRAPALSTDADHVRLWTHTYSDYLDRPTWNALPGLDEDRRVTLRDQTAAEQDVLPRDRLMQVTRRENAFTVTYPAGAPRWIHLPLFYYAGYRAETLSGAPCRLEKDEHGKVRVELPASAGTLRIWYDGLPWFHATDLLSWFSLFWFLETWLRERRRQASMPRE